MATTATSPGRRSDAAVLWAALLGVSALCWAWLLSGSGATSMSMSTPGTSSMDSSVAPTALVPFLGLWVAMMAAMMLPSVAPVARLYLRVVSAQTSGLRRAARVGGLLIGYFVAWGACGLLAFWLTRGVDSLTGNRDVSRVSVTAVALAVAGGYQFSPLKARCLAHCRSPLGVLMHVGSFTGRLRDLRVGTWHGGYCLGCCWSLMLVLVVVGVMNLVWMAALAVVILLEKVWRRGPQLSLAVGAALLVLAAVVPFQPVLVGA